MLKTKKIFFINKINSVFLFLVLCYSSIYYAKSQSQEQNNTNSHSNKNIILNSNIPDLNFIDRISFIVYCKTNIIFQKDSVKCFINIDKIVSDTVKKSPQNNDNYNMLLSLNSSLENLKIDFKKLKNDLEVISKNSLASSTTLSKTNNNNNIINNTGLNLYNNYSLSNNLNTITASGYFTKNKSARFEIYDNTIFSGNLVSLKKNPSPSIGQIVKLTDTRDFLGVANIQNSKIFDVIISGRAEIEVTAENGPIKVGDYITLSNTFAGVGMKMTDKGQSLGIALSDDIGSGKILMLIRQQNVE